MATNIEQISKIIRLTASDQDNEAISALRTVQKLLAKDGLDLASVVEAGLAARPVARFNEVFGAGFWNFGPQAAGHAKPREAPQPKKTIFVDVADIPSGFFNVTIQAQETRRTRSGDPMVFVNVTHDSPGAFKQYPAMTAFGKQAEAIQRMGGNASEPFSATIRVTPPKALGHLPIITSLQT